MGQRQRELAETARRLSGLIEVIADGLRSPGLQQKLEELEQRKCSLEIDIRNSPLPKPRLHPNMAELYRRQVNELDVALQDPTLHEEAMGILWSLVQRVEMKPAGKGFDVEFVGDIAQMIMVARPGESSRWATTKVR